MRKMEILAPAGSMEVLKAVVRAGCDAVYIGGSMFSARAYATNFTTEEVLEAIDFCHLYGVKLHLTINTCLKDKEIESLFFYVAPFYEAGLDAVIVQDMGVLALLRDNFPGLEIHASTQTTLCSEMGVGFMKNLGANRVVLARELSIPEIKKIHEAHKDIEIETFVHGALCFSYSGQCLFSSFLGGRSGNRGRCAGPCRLPFSAKCDDKTICKNKYPLSLKDFCALEHLAELEEIGVSSLKIEGRMKSARYAAGVTYIYRKALDALYAGKSIPKESLDDLMELGNRSGFTDGYLIKHNGCDMLSLDSPAHNSSKDDSLPIIRQKIGICLYACFNENCAPSITAKYNDYSITVTEDIVIEKAMNAPSSYEDIETVLKQTGDTEFVVQSLDIKMSDNIFIPKSILKKLRRKCLNELKEEILAVYKRKCVDAENKTTIINEKNTFINNGELIVEVSTIEQFDTVIAYSYVDTVIVPFDITTRNLVTRVHENNIKYVVALPKIIRNYKLLVDDYSNSIKAMADYVDGFSASTYDGLGLLLENDILPDRIIAEPSLYSFNNSAVSELQKKANTLTMPLELSSKDMDARNNANTIITIYGHAPYMVTAQCINGNLRGCNNKASNISLIDRYNKKLPVINNCKHCYNIIYNPLPTVLFDELKDVSKKKFLAQKLGFTIESTYETRKIMDIYSSIIEGEYSSKDIDFDFTRGHYKKGVD